VTAVTDRATDAYGRIDILINNAGVMPLSPMRRCQVEEWDQMIDVNVKGLLYGVAAVLPIMLAQQSGHIVNISSVAGRRPFPGGAVYSATKFAVRCISAGLRLELSPTDKIRVTDIAPGVVETELQDSITDTEVRERFQANWADKRPLASDDVARAVLYVVTQPDRVNVNEMLVRPTDQPT
jgi:NADP-dependent 3-hydroxy acid dehydrogenase YdfG